MSTPEGPAFFEGDQALQVLARIVREGRFAALDAKSALQQVYPADTGIDALVTDEQLFAARAFDVSLAAYILNSSVSTYTPNALSETYLGGALPEGKTAADALCIEAACMRACVDVLQKALEDDATLNVYREIDLPLVPVLAAMERTGAAIDAEHLHNLGVNTQADLDNLTAQIYDLAGRNSTSIHPSRWGTSCSRSSA